MNIHEQTAKLLGCTYAEAKNINFMHLFSRHGFSKTKGQDSMIQKFVDIYQEHKDSPEFTEKVRKAEDYDDLVKALIELLHANLDDDDNDTPDPERITVIDHGYYQGTRLFVIGGCGYQTSIYYSIFVDYGSCSGCDTFQSYDVREFDEDGNYERTDETVDNFKTLVLHMVQNLKKIEN